MADVCGQPAELLVALVVLEEAPAFAPELHLEGGVAVDLGDGEGGVVELAEHEFAQVLAVDGLHLVLLAQQDVVVEAAVLADGAQRVRRGEEVQLLAEDVRVEELLLHVHREASALVLVRVAVDVARLVLLAVEEPLLRLHRVLVQSALQVLAAVGPVAKVLVAQVREVPRVRVHLPEARREARGLQRPEEAADHYWLHL